MKNFHSFIYQSTDAGKKGRKNKNRSKKTDSYKCFALHGNPQLCDCPLARAPCPVHGNPHHQCFKNEKPEKDENVIISFHPTSKTDKLFRPVKNLLAHCNTETKINLEYYSPNSSDSKDGIRHRQVQANSDDFNSSGCSIFIQKSKSFVNDKTTRMKKLKRCFHSPCNSIVTEIKSQSNLREKLKVNESGAKCLGDGTDTPEEPLGDAYCERLRWTSFNKLDSSDWEKSSDDKLQSNFLTFTRQKENNVIDHKIFEIKHKKGFGDFRLTKIPKQTQIIYPSRVSRQSETVGNEFVYQSDPAKTTQSVERYRNDQKLLQKKVQSKEKMSETGSSSGSVYFTPYILVPPGMDKVSNGDSKSLLRGSVEKLDEGIQVGAASTIENFAQTESPDAQKNISVLAVPITHDKSQGSGSIISSPIHGSISGGRSTQTDEFSRKSTRPSRKSPVSSARSSFEPEHIYKNENPKINSDKLSKMETPPKREPVQERKPFLVYENVKNVRDKNTQTEAVRTQDVQVETMKPTKNKMLMTYPHVTKSVQTSLSLSVSSQSNGEFDLDSNGTFIVSSPLRPNSSQMTNQVWRKSHSDGELYSAKPQPLGEKLMPIHHICLCNSESSEMEQYEKDNRPYDENKGGQFTTEKNTISKLDQINLSDLSELAKMIDNFFDKMSREVGKQCDCDKKNEYVSPVSKKILKNAEVQTSFRVILDESEEDKPGESPNKVKVLPSVLKGDNCNVVFLCKTCSQAMSIVTFVDNSTTTNDATVEPVGKTLPVRTSKPQNTADETLPKNCVCVQEKAPSRRSEDDPKNITNKLCGKKSLNEPTDRTSREDIKQMPVGHSSLPKPITQNGKGTSRIPAARNIPRRSINFKDREPILNSPPYRPPKPSKPNDPNSILSHCIFETPGPSGSKPPKPPKPSATSKGLQRKDSKISDKTCSLSESPSWMCDTKPDPAQPNKTSSSKKSSLMYPAIVKPMWYTDFNKTWQIIKGQYEMDTFGQKQKRTCEVEDDSPAGKKVKGRNDGSGECFAFGAETRNGNRSEPDSDDLRTGAGVVWIPSLVFQLPKPETHATGILKGTKSESKLGKCSNLFKGFGKDAGLKSRRLKPVQVNEKHPFRKLFEFRLCKSLTFLKNGENFHNELSNEQEYEQSEFKYEGLINGYNPENWELSSQTDPEYAVEYSFNSDNSDSAGSAENDYVEKEEEREKETKEMNFYQPG